MRAPPVYVRIGTGIMAVAVVLVVFLLGAPGDDPETSGPPPTTAPTPSATSPSAPPSEVSAEDFCAAFTAMAAAHANHLANDTDGSRLELEAAVSALRQLAPGAVMAPEAREGLEQLIAGVLGEETATDQESADALTAYLEVSCPAGF